MTINEVKELILWAKEQRIKKISVQGLEVEFSDLAFIGTFPDAVGVEDKTSTLDTPQDIEDEELLFHSSQG